MKPSIAVALPALLVGAAACSDVHPSNPLTPESLSMEQQGKPASGPQYLVIDVHGRGRISWVNANTAANTSKFHDKTVWHLVTISDPTESATGAALLKEASCNA